MKLQLTRKSASLSIAAVLLAVAATGSAYAATDSSSADAKLISALTITNTQGLNFGTLVVQFPLTATETVTIDPNLNSAATITSSDSAKVFPLTGKLESIFTVTGEGTYAVQVTSPSTPINLSDGASHTLTVGSPSIQVHNDAATDLYNSGTGQFTMPTDGDAKLEVGGVLTITSSAVAGTYTGSFDVTIDYV